MLKKEQEKTTDFSCEPSCGGPANLASRSPFRAGVTPPPSVCDVTHLSGAVCLPGARSLTLILNQKHARSSCLGDANNLIRKWLNTGITSLSNSMSWARPRTNRRKALGETNST